MDSKICLCWTRNGKKGTREIERESFFEIMEGLKDGFSDDNDISKKFIQLIPYMLEMKINFDINETKDVPLVQYETLSGVGAISIIRHHKIVWAILEGYCK